MAILRYFFIHREHVTNIKSSNKTISGFPIVKVILAGVSVRCEVAVGIRS